MCMDNTAWISRKEKKQHWNRGCITACRVAASGQQKKKEKKKKQKDM